MNGDEEYNNPTEPDHDFSGRLKKSTDKRKPKEIDDAERAAAYRVAVNSGEQALAAFYLAYGGAPDGVCERLNRSQGKAPAPPSVPMTMRHRPPGSLPLRALKDRHHHADVVSLLPDRWRVWCRHGRRP